MVNNTGPNTELMPLSTGHHEEWPPLFAPLYPICHFFQQYHEHEVSLQDT